MTDGQDDVTLSVPDTKKVREWYKDICGMGDEEARFLRFLGKNLDYGSNRRILGRFFNLTDEKDQAKLEYFLKVYMHTTAGERAFDSDWKVRAAIFVALASTGVVFLVQLVAIPMTKGTWHSPWLWSAIVYLVAAGLFYKWSTGLMAWVKERREKKKARAP